jgi:hypothetical protein
MTLSQLIQHLQSQLDQHGDMPVQVNVRDHYTAYGNRADILENSQSGTFATSIDAGGRLVINANLRKDITGANPKITFRK